MKESRSIIYSSAEAYENIKNYYIKNYVKNSSVKSALVCFNHFKNFREYFINNDNKNTLLKNIDSKNKFLNDNKVQMIDSVFDTIQSFSENNDQTNSKVFDLRKNMDNFGLNVKYNEEIQIGKFIFYFLKILNSILNEVVINENDEKMKKIDEELGFLNPNYEFTKGNEEAVLNKIKEVYNKRISSFISRNFINIIKKKLICKCGYERYSFSMINYIPFNVDFITNNCKGNELSIENVLKYLSNDGISFSEKKGKCKYCQKFIVQKEYKSLYYTAKNLIIIFNRGENCENKEFIDFNEKLELFGIIYELIGIIVQKDDGEYLSFISSENNKWCYEGNKKNIMKFENLMDLGIVVSLFYYCNNDNKIFEYNPSSGQQYNNLSLNERNMNINPSNAIYNRNLINNNSSNSVMNNMGQGGQNINFQYPPNNNMNSFAMQNNYRYNNYNNLYNYNIQTPIFPGQNNLNMNYNNNNLQMNNFQTGNAVNFNPNITYSINTKNKIN